MQIYLVFAGPHFISLPVLLLFYHVIILFSTAVLVENGKFLLSAKRIVGATCTEYIISMNADSISRSSNTYIGKMRYELEETIALYQSLLHFLEAYCILI
jgi:hypothetical protein